MQYNINYNDMAVTLPKYSMKIAEMLEQQEKTNSGNSKFRDKCKSMYNTIKSIIGDEIREVIGDFENSDPNDINLLYLSIVNAYSSPLQEYQTDSMYSNLESVQLDKIAQLVDTLEKAGRLQINK